MGKRLLILRGDLNSSSGYAQAIELYLGRLESLFDLVLGVDLHPNPARTLKRWPYPLIGDLEVAAALREVDGHHVVLSVTTPDHFRRFHGARNIGLFFWETTALHQPRWYSAMKGMDELWLPAQFMVDMLREEGATVPLRRVPCPIADIAREARESEPASKLLLHEIAGDGSTPSITTVADVRQRYRHVALCTNTLLGRKGFPVLATEWLRFVAERDDAALLIKVASIDVTESTTALLGRVANLFRNAMLRSNATLPHVFVTTANLSAPEMNALMDASDLSVTAAFGEGLGLGMFEALFAGRPAVCPMHTSFVELFPADYRYAVACDIDNYGLFDPVGLLPASSRWGVPREGALCEALERCVADLASGESRGEVDRAIAFCTQQSTIDFAALVAAPAESLYV